MVELDTELTKTFIQSLKDDQKKAERNAEYFRGAVDGINKLIELTKQKRDEESEGKNNTVKLPKGRTKPTK